MKGKGYYKYPTSYEEAANNEAIYDAFWDRGLGLEAKNIIQDSLNPFFNNSTNWYKYIFRTGKILNANIQASGGTERMTYMVGAGYYKETGIMPGSDFSRVNLLTNLSFNSGPSPFSMSNFTEINLGLKNSPAFSCGKIVSAMYLQGPHQEV